MSAGSILIVDDIATNRVVTKVKLDAAFHRTILAEDGQSCLRRVQADRPDLVLLDYNLPDMSGLDVLRRMRADPVMRRIPVLMISAEADDAARQAALAAGADDFFAKRVDDQILLARIRNVLRLREEWDSSDLPLFQMDEGSESFAAQGRIGLIFSRPEQAMRLRRNLANVCTDQFSALQREDVLAPGPPLSDVFVIDASLARGGGLRLLSELRSRGETRHAGICLWIGADADPVTTAQAYDLGADDILSDSMPPREVALRLAAVLSRRRETQRRRQLLHDTARLAAVDALTGLWNRRYALPQLDAMARSAVADQQTLAVMALDIDRFKSVNDRFGHATGDAVLIEVGRRLRETVGRCPLASGLIARIGGEEFLVALPCRSARDARLMADALRDAVRGQPLAVTGGLEIPVTISIGVALLAGDEKTLAVLDRADRALLAAKAQGRDRVNLAKNAA